MKSGQMKNSRLVKVLAILSVMVVPLLKNDPSAFADASSSQVTVTAAELNVRETPGITSKIMGLVHLGDKLEVIQTRNNWNKIKLVNNQTGWVNNAYTAPAESLTATVNVQSLNV